MTTQSINITGERLLQFFSNVLHQLFYVLTYTVFLPFVILRELVKRVIFGQIVSRDSYSFIISESFSGFCLNEEISVREHIKPYFIWCKPWLLRLYYYLYLLLVFFFFLGRHEVLLYYFFFGGNCLFPELTEAKSFYASIVQHASQTKDSQ